MEDGRLLGRIGRLMLAGAALLIPLLLTLAILAWLAGSAEAGARWVFARVLRSDAYLPGTGILGLLGLLLLAGLASRAWLFTRVYGWFEAQLVKLPLVKTIYGGLKDLMGFFAGDRAPGSRKVVLVEQGDPPLLLVGLLTLDDASMLGDAVPDARERVGVYLPMSYQIGGYLVFVPRAQVRPLDMSFEDAMRLVVTAGISPGGS